MNQRPPCHRLAFCVTCNARDRAVIDGRCIICGNPLAKRSDDEHEDDEHAARAVA